MGLREEYNEANRRAKEMQARLPRAVLVRYDRKTGLIVVHLSSKLIISFSPADAEGLENARPADLGEIEITPSGFDLYFPRIDAGIYIPGLMEGILGSRRWMAARLGQAGGQSTSRLKKAASRANGRLGGRPKKDAKR